MVWRWQEVKGQLLVKDDKRSWGDGRCGQEEHAWIRDLGSIIVLVVAKSRERVTDAEWRRLVKRRLGI